MAMLGRRFVNIVAAGKYKPGMLSVHALDVSKHLFYPSASEARARLVGGGGDGGEAPRPRPPTTKTKTLQELPAPCAIFKAAAAARTRTRSTAFLSPLGADGSRILFINEAGDSKMYHAAGEGSPTDHTHAMPRLEEFAAPVGASASIIGAGAGAGAAAMEESLYVMHGVREGVPPRFHVLRPPPPTTTTTPHHRRTTSIGEEGWYWQSLPPPPFVSDDDDAELVISCYTVVDGGRTICVSADAAEEEGAWCFDTVTGEWWLAGDWEMPFYGRAEYLADLDLWLGFPSSSSLRPYVELGTATAGLSSLSPAAMAKNRPPPPTVLQRLYTPRDMWMERELVAAYAKKVELINLGSGRFAIAKVFSWNHDYTDFEYAHDDDFVVEDKYDELLVVSGVEIRPRQPRDSCDLRSCSDGLELIPHKSVGYMCGTHRIHQVL